LKKIKLNNNIQILNQLSGIFQLNEIAEFMYKNNYGILIILDFIKANDWPKKNKKLDNTQIRKIPMLWGLLYALNDKEIEIIYDIHPTKCFPNLYIKNNVNYHKNHIIINKVEGYTLGGCPRYIVKIKEYQYTVLDKIVEYCSIFGLPDDCYNSKFEIDMIETLKKYKNLEIWSFEKNDYFIEKIEPIISIKYMKGSFLPKQYYIYIDSSLNFLKGIYSSKEIEPLKNQLWYKSGRNFIYDMNINDNGFRFEEQAIYYIRKKLIYEFIRQSLLLKNKTSFSSFTPNGTPPLNLNDVKNFQHELEKIINPFKIKIIEYLNNIYKQIKHVLNESLFNKSRFLVTDLEFIHVSYPNRQNQRYFNFPCIFSSIIWLGPRKKFVFDLNLFKLPCNFCSKICSLFKRKFFNYNCLIYGLNFIERQQNMIENLLIENEGFKIYSYGKSDIFQFEQGVNFFDNSFEIKEYERKNRKRKIRITKVHEDISFDNMSLKEIEDKILKKWLIGWKRKEKKLKVNKRFMTLYTSPNWTEKYREVINSITWDNISAFLFLIYNKFILNKNKIRIIIND